VSHPKYIFSYWHQGWEVIPPIVDVCLKSMSQHHRDWKIHLLDADTATDWLEPIPIPEKKWEKLPLAHRSDVIRTQLLLRNGGVWADPTVWFTGSMDKWLSARMNAGLFLFRRPGRDRLISNWFIAAQPGNPLLARLYDELCRYWRENDFETIGFTRRRGVNIVARILNRNLRLPQIWLSRPLRSLFRHAPYMVYHYLFAKVVRTDPRCAAIWAETPRESADAPHRLLRHGLLQPLTQDIERVMQSTKPPLFKLTWKLGGIEVPDNSVLAELFRRESLEIPSPEKIRLA